MYDKASLALIPSGYKSGGTDNLYSVLPANGNGDFNATRGSTATRVNKDGLIESVATNVPRLDYPLTNGVVGDCPHLLLEPQRRNLATDSKLALLTGGSSGSISTTGDGASTDVTLSNGLTGKKITVSSSGRSYLNITCTVVSGTEYTVSIFVENYSGASQSNFIDILSGGGGEDFSSDLISNGRIQGTFTATSTSVTIRVGHGTTSTRTGFFSVNISGIQLEDGGSGIDATYATSLIHTTGIIETRSADVCNSSGTSAEFNDSEGVLFAEIAALANDGTYRAVSISDGTLDNRVSFYFRVESNRINFRVRTDISGTPTDSFNNTYDVSNLLEFKKIALKYKQNDFAVWVNGVEVLTEPNGNVFSSGTLNRLSFDRADGGDDFYGKCKQLIYFNEVLSDSELQTLTS